MYMNVLTKEGIKIGLPVLGVFTEAGNWTALEVATNGLETGKDKQDLSVCKAASRDKPTD